MAERISNVGQIRKVIEGLSDETPVESWLNGVETYVSMDYAGGETGEEVNINVEPNYTCMPEPTRSVPGAGPAPGHVNPDDAAS